MSKQTTVEWLEEKLKENLKHIVLNSDYVLMESIFLQAKAMEREQMGLPNCKQIDGISSITIIDPATGKVLGKGGEQ